MFDFEKVKESVVNAGKEVGGFAKDMSTLAKLKYNIHEKERFLEKQYALLGKAFYEAHKDEDVEEKVYFPSIREAEEELIRLHEQVLEAQGAEACPNCGSKQEAGKGYCANCGSPLK